LEKGEKGTLARGRKRTGGHFAISRRKEAMATLTVEVGGENPPQGGRFQVVEKKGWVRCPFRTKGAVTGRKQNPQCCQREREKKGKRCGHTR